MKKIILLSASLISSLALTGCASTSVKVTAGCKGGSSSSTSCSVGVTGSTKKSASDANFDASLASIDLSSSNVSVTSGTGTLQVSIKNTSGSTIASTVFNWYASGDTLHPSNPTAMSAWVNANWQSGYDLVLDASGIETTGNIGTNTVTAIFDYGSGSIGDSDSFYLNDADMNGF